MLPDVGLARRARTLARYAEHRRGGRRLMMEHTAHALNPAQGLVAGARLVDLVRDAGGHTHLLDLLESDLAGQRHAVYEVRRVLRPRKDDPTPDGECIPLGAHLGHGQARRDATSPRATG